MADNTILTPAAELAAKNKRTSPTRAQNIAGKRLTGERSTPRLAMFRTVCDAVSFSKAKRSGRRQVAPIAGRVVN